MEFSFEDHAYNRMIAKAGTAGKQPTVATNQSNHSGGDMLDTYSDSTVLSGTFWTGILRILL